MSIANKLQLLSQDITNARTAITTMGGTVTENGGTSQLASDIQTIPVFVGISREISQDGTFQLPQTDFTFVIPSNAVKIGEDALQYAFTGSTYLVAVDMSSIAEVREEYAMRYAFAQCPNLATVDLRTLAWVEGERSMERAFNSCTSLVDLRLNTLAIVRGVASMAYCFAGCAGLKNINLPWLTYIGTYSDTSATTDMAYCFDGCSAAETLNLGRLKSVGYSGLLDAFRNCTSLTTVDLHSLEQIGRSGLSSAFMVCSSLETVSFPKLNKIQPQALYQAFAGCTSLEHLYFPALTMDSFEGNGNQMAMMLTSCSNVTVHFSSALDNATFKNLNFVRNGFSGTNTRILYDL